MQFWLPASGLIANGVYMEDGDVLMLPRLTSYTFTHVVIHLAMRAVES